ncbi:MAG: hypothetical protein ACR2PK_01465, partial [Acidimicrobiales bacterium]
SQQPFTEPTAGAEPAPAHEQIPPSSPVPAMATDEVLPPVPPTHSLPPPPDQDLLDLNDNQLEEAIGASIDDELFGDEPVIDLTDDDANAAPGAGRFEFFSRER